MVRNQPSKRWKHQRLQLCVGNYIKATETDPSSYDKYAKSSVSLNSALLPWTSYLDYHTKATSDGGVLKTEQLSTSGASSQPSALPDDASGLDVTFSEYSYNKDSGVTKDYASSSLKAAGSGKVGTYEGSSETTSEKASVNSQPQAVSSDTSVTYQTYAKDALSRYAKTYALSTAAPLGGPSAWLSESSPGTASAEDSGLVTASFNDLSANGDKVKVLSDENDGTNRYYIQSDTSRLDPIAVPTEFRGSASSTLGQEAKQNIQILKGGSVSLRDYRKKDTDILYTTLKPVTKSFTGTATSSDSGHIIQDNVNIAASGDSLYLSTGTFRENVVIEKSLKVYGAGKDKTVVNGDANGDGIGDGCVFNIGYANVDIDVILSGMTITKGTGIYYYPYTFAGGVFNGGRTTISQCRISENSATYQGGGIYNVGSLNIMGSSIIRNSGGIFGGGIYNQGELTIMGSTITENSANTGGGIFNYNPLDRGWLKLVNSIVSKNVAAAGGGIFNYIDGKTTITSSTISENSAEDNGGGVFNELGTVTIEGSIISKNTAGGNGGGIYANCPDKYRVGIREDNRIFQNIADYDRNDIGTGGGIYYGGSLIFYDKDGIQIPLADPRVHSIVYDNHIQDLSGSESNIYP